MVKIAAHLSHTGEERVREFGIDSCIAPLVAALQAGGIDMLASCCGHGKAPGRIDLADGRVLVIDAAQSDEGDDWRLVEAWSFCHNAQIALDSRDYAHAKNQVAKLMTVLDALVDEMP